MTDKTHADRLAEALEECLREHGGFAIKGLCETRARQALAAYRASKEDGGQSVEDDELEDDLAEALEISRGICEVLRDEYEAVKAGKSISSPMTVTLGAWDAFNGLHRQITHLQSQSANTWCFDMDKAPRDKRILGYDGETVTEMMWMSDKDDKDHIGWCRSGFTDGGMLYYYHNDFGDTPPIAWRALPIAPPKTEAEDDQAIKAAQKDFAETLSLIHI